MSDFNAIVRGVLAAVLILAGSSVWADPSNKWRLEFSGAAESDGEMVFSILPDGQPAQVVTVIVGKADGENEIVEKARVAFLQAVGTDYHVSRDDGEDLLLKRRDGAGEFEVMLTSNTVQAVRVGFDRE